jgi:hypothetical protein
MYLTAAILVADVRTSALGKAVRVAAAVEMLPLKPVASFPCAAVFGGRRWRGRRQVAIGPPGLFGLVRRDNFSA